MSGVTDKLASIWESISEIPNSIVDGLKGFFLDVKDAILGLPQRILDGIKAIIVPDSEYIEDAFNGFVDELKMKFGVDTSIFESLFDNESVVSDIEENYKVHGVGNFKLKFFDTKYLVQGVTYFRPFIRGFIVLMLFIFNVRQLIGFFGGHSGAEAERRANEE